MLESQQLQLVTGADVARVYSVSTAVLGAGEKRDSGCTPRGRHRIRLKIGAGCPGYAVFVGRRYTGELWTPRLADLHPDRDWILSRIIWLTGTESGHNRGGDCDTLRRFIYIHGTPPDEPMGIPRSHGCIRMRNEDIIELFDSVAAGMVVDIRD